MLLQRGDKLLERLFSDKLVCFAGWKPEVKQTFIGPPSKAEFVDRRGDYADWVVKKQVGAVP